MKRPVTLLVSILALALGTPVWSAPTGEELLDRAEARVREFRSRIQGTSDPLEQARLLLLTGEPAQAARALDALGESGPETVAIRLRTHLALAQFAEARNLLEEIHPHALEDPDLRGAAYEIWVLEDDLPRLESESGKHNESQDLAARGRLAALLLRDDAAMEWYRKALESSQNSADSARAYHGLGAVEHHRRRFDESLEDLAHAVRLSDPDPDLLLSLANTLIRLGETADATRAAKLAVAISPRHEAGHYLLGNGYTDRNYTELFAAYPDAFAGTAGAPALARADSLLAWGETEAAQSAYERIAEEHPAWADARVRLGSLAFAGGDFDRAMKQFEEALALCPDYGRAHNGMAKAVEGKRLLLEVHRAAYEEAFAAQPMPEIPGIETFVTNWFSLTPRHRKRVALSVAPWARYLPVLVASGATYYIKPLYELLSESPGQEILRDQRINYDSRLWDDVRGCGGYHTVTGIEDVERTIQNRYNTVLHELTHQVHAVLTADRKRSIQELYRKTKERDENGTDAFLSRYAGGSVWEYFAEGANALYSPRRDAYDTRDIVRERLLDKDPALENLVVELMTTADVESCYAIGLVNRGDDRMERGLVLEAIPAYREALARAPEDESAIAACVYALEVADSLDSAVRFAARAAEVDPASAVIAVRRAYALWESDGGLPRAIASLEEARGGVREADRYRVDLALGSLRWTDGDAEGARAAYEAVLEYQADNPEGLWGIATALALAGRWEEAFDRYEEAVRLRTGVVELRVDYARDLLRAGRPDAARAQIDAALLLDAEDPGVLALDAWWLAENGRTTEAEARAGESLELAPWCDLGRLVLARVQAAEGEAEAARKTLGPVLHRIENGLPPRYVYRSKWGRYDLVHTLPRVERSLIP